MIYRHIAGLHNHFHIGPIRPRGVYQYNERQTLPQQDTSWDLPVILYTIIIRYYD